MSEEKIEASCLLEIHRTSLIQRYLNMNTHARTIEHAKS